MAWVTEMTLTMANSHDHTTIMQWNLNHGRVAGETQAALANESNADIMIISDPYMVAGAPKTLPR